jgi:ubiquinone/menaquinone biosynthesis C-methylase UbiE
MDFDDKARTWDSDPIKRERALAVAAAIRQRVPLARDWRALEYGCGTGLLSFALHAELGQMTLADSSSGMLAVLAEKITA